MRTKLPGVGACDKQRGHRRMGIGIFHGRMSTARIVNAEYILQQQQQKQQQQQQQQL